MRKILLLIFLLSFVLPACGESDWGPDMQAAVISALQARADGERAAFNEIVLDEAIWENIRGCEGKDFSSDEFTYEDNWGEGWVRSTKWVAVSCPDCEEDLGKFIVVKETDGWKVKSGEIDCP